MLNIIQRARLVLHRRRPQGLKERIWCPKCHRGHLQFVSISPKDENRLLMACGSCENRVVLVRVEQDAREVISPWLLVLMAFAAIVMLTWSVLWQ